jgi:hypothetical protein
MSILLFDLAPTGDPWVPVNPMGMSLGTKLNPSRVMSFLIDGFCICEHGFGMAKPSGFVMAKISGFVPVAIFKQDRQPLHFGVAEGAH